MNALDLQQTIYVMMLAKEINYKIWDVLLQLTLRHALMICGNAQNTFAAQRVLGKHWLTANQCWFLEIPVDKVESETQLHHKIHKLIHLQRKIFHAHMNFANQVSLWNLLNLLHLLLLYAKLIVQKQERMHKMH